MADIIDRDELIRGALEAYQRALEKVGNSFKDIVHVVRCKDCKHYWKNKPSEDVPVCLASPREDAYCSAGERREDGKAD